MDKNISGKEKAQLVYIKKQKRLNSLLKKIAMNNKLNDDDAEYLLSNALLMLQLYNADNRYKSYFRLGYYIILKYSLLHQNYRPLYDLSSQIGFFPICKSLVSSNNIIFNNASEEINYNLMLQKFINSKDAYIETLEQYQTKKSLVNSALNHKALIAPTSYGKSSLIIDSIISNDFKKIAVIVPTKSLLIQTYKSIKDERLNFKLVLHDEMYDGEDSFIGILTQERTMRLLKRGVIFDALFIDEAHNLLKYKNSDSRGVLLSRVIKLNGYKNADQKVMYLSPLIENTNNLCLNKEDKIFSKFIAHNLKSEELFLYEENSIKQYNKFTDELYELNNNIGFFEYIDNNSKKKNFIYNHRPIKIEKLAHDLAQNIENIDIDAEIKKIMDTLKNEVHENFNVIKSIRKGIVYIHGMMPNLVKEYLEYQFEKVLSLRYIIANSVILEGINLPIDCLFITSTYYLDGKGLTNLIGRVNRLNYIFRDNAIEKLIPKIHFINSEEYQGKLSMINKMKLLRDHSFEDHITNPMLTNYDINKLNLQKTKNETKEQVVEKRKKRDQEILDSSEFLIKNNKLSREETVKKYFIENSIDDFYLDYEKQISKITIKIENFQDSNEFTDLNLIQKIYKLFIQGNEDQIKDFEVERLKNDKARIYYQNYLEYNQKQTLKQNIIETWKYFIGKSKESDSYLFIGSAYGEESKITTKYNSHTYNDKVYVNLSGKSKDDLINLAVVKLKIEENFVSYKLNKFIVFLYDFNLITEDEYFLYVYGTTDHNLIRYARLGINLNSIRRIHNDKQLNNIYLDSNGNLKAKDDFYNYLETQDEFFKFEMQKYL